MFLRTMGAVALTGTSLSTLPSMLWAVGPGLVVRASKRGKFHAHLDEADKVLDKATDYSRLSSDKGDGCICVIFRCFGTTWIDTT